MTSIQMRILFGFIAGAVSVLTFHQAAWELLHVLKLPGLAMPAAYPTGLIPPFNVPRIVSLSCWGGLWGVLFAIVWHGRPNLWIAGLGMGVAAVCVGFFIVAPLKDQSIEGAFVLNNWIRSLLINGFWGVGVSLLLTGIRGFAARRGAIATR